MGGYVLRRLGAGVVLLALAGGAEAGISPLGVGLAVIAGGSYATYTLASKRLLEDGHAPEGVMAALFGLGAVALAPVLLFARGLRGLRASEAATITLLEPVTAATLGVFVLGERVTGAGALGAALVLGGLVLLALRPARRPLPTVAEPA